MKTSNKIIIAVIALSLSLFIVGLLNNKVLFYSHLGAKWVLDLSHLSADECVDIDMR